MPALARHIELAERDQRLVGAWLVLVCLMLALMVIVGGATRLTNSGLSITEWRPVTGAVPPLSQEAWQAEFEKYQQIPQYRLMNRGMSLAQFKSIYWWEWGHRLLGRLIGVVFFVPLVWFALRRTLHGPLIRRLAMIFVLGGAQGALGWWMVKSGLVHRVEVSQYRLAAHLGLAFIIFALTFWTALDVLRPRTDMRAAPPTLRLAAFGLAGLVFVQGLLGALVAGLRAGYRYNTWPLMEGGFVPMGIARLTPLWRNFTENQATVQFDHRIGAYAVAAFAVALWLWARQTSSGPLRRALDLCVAAVGVQILLGIWTLLEVVPLWLGLLHQTGALLLFAATINLVHAARAAPKPARQGAISGQGVPIQSLDSGP